MTELMLPDLAATHAFGRGLGEEARAGQAIALVGPLGAGKTTLTAAIAAGAGFPDAVTSPTFSLVHEYHGGRLPVFHLDFYRLESIHELANIGWDDLIDAGGLLVVEWADRFAGAMPESTLWVEISAPTHGVRSVWTGSRAAWSARQERGKP